MLVGTNHLSLDSQRRFAVPHKWRSGEDKESFYLLYRTDGRDPHILLCSKKSFENITEKIPDLAFMNPKKSASLLSIAHNLEESICDKQGRINLPEHLKENLGIEKDLVITGAFNHAYIWHPDIWNEYQKGIKNNVVSANDFSEMLQV